MPTYTAISFAPVQGFIEKSRKLRDLFGASLILSYLSQQTVRELEQEGTVISPTLPRVQDGMPNRILVKADERIDRDLLKKILSSWPLKISNDVRVKGHQRPTRWGNALNRNKLICLHSVLLLVVLIC